MNKLLTHANLCAERWATLVLTSLIEAALLLGLIGLVWLVVRRRVSPRFGAGLFALVPLKLILPLVVTVPSALAVWTPSNLVDAWRSGADLPSRLAASGPRPALVIESPNAIAPTVRPPVDSPPRPGFEAASPSTDAPAHRISQIPRPVEVAPRLVRPSVALLACVSWLGGVTVLVGWSIRTRASFRAKLRTASPIHPASLGVDFGELCRRVGLVRPVRLVEVESIDSPAVRGIIAPLILLPRGIGTMLTSGQLRWVLLHELAHIRHRDLVVVALQRLAATIHFFNPTIWIANRLIHQLREYACDDLAVALARTSPVEAGEAFVRIVRGVGQRRRNLNGALGVFGLDSRTACLRRVHRLLDTNRPLRTAMGLPSRLALVVLAACALPYVRAAGPARSESPQVPIAQPSATANPTPTKPVDPVPHLQAGKNFELTVHGPGGRPVAGAIVDFRSNNPPTAEQVRRGGFRKKSGYGSELTTDDAGMIVVTFEAVPAGLALDITTPGYGPYWASWSSGEHQETIPSRFTAELEAGWSVGGQVVGPDNQPVAKARIHPSIEYRKRPGDSQQLGIGKTIVTDAEGRWRFDSVPAAMGALHVSIDQPDFSPLRLELPRLEYGLARDAVPSARIALDRGLALSGKITDENAKPIAGATIRTEFVNEIRVATSDANGIYTLTGCEPIRTTIVVTAPGRAADFRQVNADPDLGSVDFTLRPGGTIRVRVLNHEGKPEPKARIFFQRWRGEQLYFAFNEIDQYADESGVWTWDQAPNDEFLADICPSGRDGMQLTKQPLTPRAEEYVFRLPATLVVSGTVIDAATKLPINQFRVIPGGRYNNQPQWFQSSAFAATDGRFEYRGDRSGQPYLVQIEAPGYRPLASRDIGWNEGNVALTFEVRRAASETARVLTPDAQPAVGARVALGVNGVQIGIVNGQIDDGWTYAARRTTDANGQFTIPPQIGKYELVVTHPSGYANIASPTEGESLRDIQLKSWTRVEGTLRIGSNPGANVPMRLEAPGATDAPRIAHIFNQYQSATDSQGRFVFDRVIPGRGWVGRRIIMTVNDGAKDVTSTHMVALDLFPGATVQANIGGTGRAVVGKLIPEPGFKEKVRWNFAQVQFQPEPRGDQLTDSFTATVGPDGTFRIDDVPEGSYALRASIDHQDAGFLHNYRFTVPPTEAKSPADPVDLGSLQLVPRPKR